MQGLPEPDEHEARLAEFYDLHATTPNTRALTTHRTACRQWFIRLLKDEHRHSVFELGCGTGVEGSEFVRAGLHYTGVDLSEASVHLARGRRLEVSMANGRSLPFPDGVFAGIWTMSTLLHVPNARIHDVMDELVRVSAPGAPIAIGLWSGDDEEVLNPEDLDEPRRFFSRRSDTTVRRLFGEHGAIVHFETWLEGKGTESGPGAGQWTQHYQFLVVRTPLVTEHHRSGVSGNTR